MVVPFMVNISVVSIQQVLIPEIIKPNLYKYLERHLSVYQVQWAKILSQVRSKVDVILTYATQITVSPSQLDLIV
jgi:hypothetical protein